MVDRTSSNGEHRDDDRHADYSTVEDLLEQFAATSESFAKDREAAQRQRALMRTLREAFGSFAKRAQIFSMEQRRFAEERTQLLEREREARAEAEAAHERLNQVLESIGDAFFALDRRWRLTYANDRALRLAGQLRHELLGKSVLEAFPELVEGVASTRLLQAEESRNATQFECYSKRLRRWLHYRVYPSPAGLSVYVTDITRQKEAEERLRASEEEYRSIFELAGVGKAQTDLETGRFLRVNRRLCEITGYTPEELMERTFAEITHPEDREHNCEGLERMMRGEIDEYETEKRYVCKDGVVIWARVNATAVRDPEGRPLRSVATIEDITEHKQAEEELKNSEELYRLIADNSTDMISKHTPEGVYTYVSPACRSLLGYEPEELIGRSAYEFFYPEDVEAIQETHSTILELPDTYTITYRIRRRDGSYIWFETTSRTIRDPETDEVREILADSRDISERKRIEEEKLQLAEHMNLLLESTDEGIFGVNQEGKCTFINRSAAQMLGYDPEEILGKNIHEICHHSYKDGSPYPIEACPIYQALETGQGVRIDDEVFWRRDGSSFPIEYSSNPVVEDGVVKGSIATFTDITERKRAEEELRKSEERYRVLYEDNPFMYFTVDAEGTVLSVNSSGARQLGYTVEELVGSTMLDIFHEEDREGVERYFSLCVRDLERPTSWEARKVRKDGSVLWAREHVRIVRGSDGDMVVLLLCQDITEHKRAEEARERLLAREWTAHAQAAERRRISRELHDRVAHSMGVVHQSLQLYKALLSSDPSQAEAKLDLAGEMSRAALDSTRNLAMKLREPAAADLQGALSNLLSDFVPSEIETDLSVEGDESRIPAHVREQLFLILREAVRNAVSHSGCHRLSISLEVLSEKVTGTVEDDGCGFDTEASPRGAGLESMQERTALVAGTCTVRSEPDGGTSVQVSIPLTQKERQ